MLFIFSQSTTNQAPSWIIPKIESWARDENETKSITNHQRRESGETTRADKGFPYSFRNKEVAILLIKPQSSPELLLVSDSKLQVGEEPAKNSKK